MKQVILALLLALISLTVLARSGGHSGSHSYGTGSKSEYTHASGYTKKNGVAPYDRSTPDHTKNNNWSTKGNTNPETGKQGTQKGDEE